MITFDSKALLLDVDGLLIDRTEAGEEFLLQKSVKKVQELYHLGIIVCAVTNRERTSYDEVVRRLGMPVDEMFDHTQTRTEAGFDKSDPAAHIRMARILRNLYGIEPKMVKYLDNNFRNCLAARAVNFDVIGVMSKSSYEGLDRHGDFPIVDSLEELEIAA